MPRTASSAGRSGNRRKPVADRSGLPSIVQAGLDDLIEGPEAQVAVALSGGSDSTALLHLTLEWARDRGTSVSALIVDHGLRAEAGAEAETVAAGAAQAGATAQVLRWDGPHPVTGIQEAAREARYALMTDWCRTNGIHHLLLGHQMEDQAATVLMRVRRGSGVDGLSAMAPSTVREGVTIVRPLLDIRRQVLRDWLTARAISWIEDPTNGVERFERNRIDHFLESEADGADLVGSLALLARRQAQAAGALDHVAQDRWTTLRLDTQDGIRLNREDFLSCPTEIRIRLMSMAIVEITGRKPRLSALETLSELLTQAGTANAGGVLVRLSRDAIIFTPEPPRR